MAELVRENCQQLDGDRDSDDDDVKLNFFYLLYELDAEKDPVEQNSGRKSKTDFFGMLFIGIPATALFDRMETTERRKTKSEGQPETRQKARQQN